MALPIVNEWDVLQTWAAGYNGGEGAWLDLWAVRPGEEESTASVMGGYLPTGFRAGERIRLTRRGNVIWEGTTGQRPVEPKLRFRKVDEDTYEVSRGNEVLGRVFKGWWRLGGWGWGTSTHMTSGHSTRRAAARALARDYDEAARGFDYPYIRGWGVMGGSLPYYVNGQLHRAREEKAPADAIYKDANDGHWHTFSGIVGPSTRRRLQAIVDGLQERYERAAH